MRTLFSRWRVKWWFLWRNVNGEQDRMRICLTPDAVLREPTAIYDAAFKKLCQRQNTGFHRFFAGFVGFSSVLWGISPFSDDFVAVITLFTRSMLKTEIA